MRYWVYINDSVLERPFSREELPSIIGFNRETLICPEVLAPGQTQEWLPARLLLEPQIQQPLVYTQPQQYYTQPVIPAAEQNPTESILLEKLESLSQELREIKEKLFSLTEGTTFHSLQPLGGQSPQPQVNAYQDPLKEAFILPQDGQDNVDNMSQIPDQEPVYEEVQPIIDEPIEALPIIDEPIEDLPIEDDFQDIPMENFDDIPTVQSDPSQDIYNHVSEDVKPMEIIDMSDDSSLPTNNSDSDFLEEAIKTTFTKRVKPKPQDADEIIDLAAHKESSEHTGALVEATNPVAVVEDADDIPTIDADDAFASDQEDVVEDVKEDIPQEISDIPAEVPAAMEINTNTSDTDRIPVVEEIATALQGDIAVVDEELDQDLKTEIIEDYQSDQVFKELAPVVEELQAQPLQSGIIDMAAHQPQEDPQPLEIIEEQPLEQQSIEGAFPVEESPAQEQQPEDVPLQFFQEPVASLDDVQSLSVQDATNRQPVASFDETTDQDDADIDNLKTQYIDDEQFAQPAEQDETQEAQALKQAPSLQSALYEEESQKPQTTEYDALNIEKTESIEEKSVLEEFAADKQETKYATPNMAEQSAQEYFEEVQSQSTAEESSLPAQQEGLSALEELTGRSAFPAQDLMSNNLEDQFLKTFTSSIEEVFLDQPTAIISDYVPPQISNPEIYETEQPEYQPQQPMPIGKLMDLKSMPDANQGQAVRSVRRIKPAAIKTVPMVAANGEDIQNFGAGGANTQSAPNIDEAIAELGGSSPILKFVKMFSALMVLLLILLLFIALLATMGIVPTTMSPAHAVIIKVFGDKEDEALKQKESAIIDQVTLDAVNEAEAKKKNASDVIINKVQNYTLAEGRTLFEKVTSTHFTQIDEIDWTADQAVDPNYYSIAVKLPPNQEGYSLTYRFSYDQANGVLVPTTSESNNIMLAPQPAKVDEAQVLAPAAAPATQKGPTPKIRRTPRAR